jgi:hypothetical protein
MPTVRANRMCEAVGSSSRSSARNSGRVNVASATPIAILAAVVPRSSIVLFTARPYSDGAALVAVGFDPAIRATPRHGSADVRTRIQAPELRGMPPWRR